MSAFTVPTGRPDDAVELSTGESARARHHPRWCDRQQCITSAGAARHSSTATRLITGEQTFALTLIQHDPYDPELFIEVTGTADPDGLHVLALPEIKALAETLLIAYLQAASLVRNPGGTTATTRDCRVP
ncbi:MAG: hypothetical protein ACRDRR_21880 [Pseudonocardiaceae bacterium]